MAVTCRRHLVVGVRIPQLRFGGPLRGARSPQSYRPAGPRHPDPGSGPQPPLKPARRRTAPGNPQQPELPVCTETLPPRGARAKPRGRASGCFRGTEKPPPQTQYQNLKAKHSTFALGVKRGISLFPLPIFHGTPFLPQQCRCFPPGVSSGHNFHCKHSLPEVHYP